jgi:hypothetical protein
MELANLLKSSSCKSVALANLPIMYGDAFLARIQVLSSVAIPRQPASTDLLFLMDGGPDLRFVTWRSPDVPVRNPTKWCPILNRYHRSIFLQWGVQKFHCIFSVLETEGRPSQFALAARHRLHADGTVQRLAP